MLCQKSPVVRENIIKIEIELIINNNDICIEIPSSVSNNTLILTIDTAAQISVLRPHKLDKSLEINNLEKISVLGVAEKIKLTTLGTLNAQLKFNNVPFSHKFHILNQGFKLKTDGLLGMDFLREINAKIDFLSKKLQLRIRLNSNDINVSNKIIKSTSLSSSFLSVLQTDSERSTDIGINSKNFYELIPNSYFDSDNFDEIVPQKIDLLSEMDELEDFHIFAFDTSNQISDIEERTSYLMNRLNKNKIGEQFLHIIEHLIRENSDVFYIEGDIFIPTDVYKHRIVIKPNSQIAHVKQFRLPQCDRLEINRQVKELLDNGIIEESRSPFNAPVFLVDKATTSDGTKSKRIVQDFKALNAISKEQFFNIPLIDDVINQLHGAQIFTSLDVRAAFNSVMLHEDSRELTAFSTNMGHFQYRCVPFGIQSGPVAWNYTANIILRKFLNQNYVIQRMLNHMSNYLDKFSNNLINTTLN